MLGKNQCDRRTIPLMAKNTTLANATCTMKLARRVMPSTSWMGLGMILIFFVCLPPPDRSHRELRRPFRLESSVACVSSFIFGFPL